MKLKIITFSGVDGAGKTTILREVKEVLQNKYMLKVVELRQRPSILPILSSIKYGRKAAELKTQDVLPRSGKNSSKLSSYIRFFYYLSDYIFGQWIVYFKYTTKGYVVIYDRYYFDYIADPKRANIVINKSFAELCYKFIIKPEINIFLYAPAEVILKRKQELDCGAIEILTDNYKRFFEQRKANSDNQYVCLKNIDKDETLTEIQKILERHL